MDTGPGLVSIFISLRLYTFQYQILLRSIRLGASKHAWITFFFLAGGDFGYLIGRLACGKIGG
jgi:hypothetical protein